MTAEVTTPPPTQRQPTSRSRAQASGPQPTTTLTVPAKPAAVTSANVAALAGTAVAATGPLGVALATVVAGGAAGGYAVYRAVSHRRANRAAALGYPAGMTGGGGRGTPRVGRAGAATPGGRSAGSRSAGSGRGSAAGSGRGPAGGSSRSGGAATPKGKGLFGLGRSGTSKAGGRGSTAGGRGAGTSGHRRAGSAPGSGSRSPLTAGKVAAARRKLSNRREPGPRLSDAIRSATGRTQSGARPTGREAFRNARRAVTGDNPKKRGTVRRAAAGLAAGLVAADKAQRERWQARKRAEAARQAKNDRAAAGRPQTRPQTPTQPQRRTGSTVRRPNTHQPQPNTSRPPVSTPGGTSPSSNGRNPVMSAQGQHTPQPTSLFFQSARQLFANAVKFKPKGMIEVRTEAYELPHSLQDIAAALRARAQECTKQPLHSNFAAALVQIAATVESASQASRTLGPAFDALHPTEVARILKPRVNEGAWDTTNNR